MKKTALIRKFKSLVERIRLSESEYFIMKEQIKMLEAISSAMTIEQNWKSKSITDRYGNEILHRVEPSLQRTLEIDVKKLFETLRIPYDRDNTIVNVRR